MEVHMKIKAVVITLFIIGALFTGSAMADSRGAVSGSSDYGWHGGAAEGQRGVAEQESRPGYSARCEIPNQHDWRNGAVEGQRGTPQQDSGFGLQAAQRDRNLQASLGGWIAYAQSITQVSGTECEQYSTLPDALRPADGP
jgi:hypothetical protein